LMGIVGKLEVVNPTQEPTMPTISIRITTETRKALEGTLTRAFKAGDLELVKRVTALLGIARGEPVKLIAVGVGVSPSTVYAWLRAFLLEGVAGLRVRWRGGRPRKLTKTQRQQLAAIIEAGPEAAGFPTGCWHALLIQQVIQREFGVTYNVQYLATLLHSLGFSFQKARFVSDHLDAVARAAWLAYTFPAWRAQAEAAGRLLLFGDEASFVQWGSLSYTWARVGQQPVVKTTGRRKAYKVFGLIELFSGRLFYQGIDGRCLPRGTRGPELHRLPDHRPRADDRAAVPGPGWRTLPSRCPGQGVLRAASRPLARHPPAQLLAGLQPDRVPLAGDQAFGHPQPLLPRVHRPDRLGRGCARRLLASAGPRQGPLRALSQAHGRTRRPTPSRGGGGRLTQNVF
jgi:transposase